MFQSERDRSQWAPKLILWNEERRHIGKDTENEPRMEATWLRKDGV